MASFRLQWMLCFCMFYLEGGKRIIHWILEYVCKTFPKTSISYTLIQEVRNVTFLENLRTYSMDVLSNTAHMLLGLNFSIKHFHFWCFLLLFLSQFFVYRLLQKYVVVNTKLFECKWKGMLITLENQSSLSKTMIH